MHHTGFNEIQKKQIFLSTVFLSVKPKTIIIAENTLTLIRL